MYASFFRICFSFTPSPWACIHFTYSLSPRSTRPSPQIMTCIHLPRWKVPQLPETCAYLLSETHKFGPVSSKDVSTKARYAMENFRIFMLSEVASLDTIKVANTLADQ
jgi:hypothetical protein